MTQEWEGAASCPRAANRCELARLVDHPLSFPQEARRALAWSTVGQALGVQQTAFLFLQMGRRTVLLLPWGPVRASQGWQLGC